MKEFIEKLIGRLEEKIEIWRKDVTSGVKQDSGYLSLDTSNKSGRIRGLLDAIKIVNQLAEEYNGGWINSDADLPKENGWYWGYYVTSSYIGTDGVKHTECKYASIYWEDNLWLYNPRSFRTVDEVIAWKPIAPYPQKGE